jgi:hypothetical protein
MDMQGQVIPGLYCGDESASGFNQHGLGRCAAHEYIAGKNAAAESPRYKHQSGLETPLTPALSLARERGILANCMTIMFGIQGCL